ncbi:recombinase family protein [Nonomuraea insulae]|uniref:Recombinase family protein n=1 Tax=Nonomuraea insulae TaxID=1616787 RepID=A0ABW1D117_9ACTN
MSVRATEAVSFPWEDNDDVKAAQAAEIPLSVAWLGRTSTDDQQDPTLSLPRQLRSSRNALPAGSLIVAHFYDVESGRMDLEARGRGHAHEAFDIPISRDGGIQDLLAEAKRPDRRFAAVICESIERVARRTYFGTKVEYELEQAGVMLLAADEPLPQLRRPSDGRSRKQATPMLTRRVKQAVSEWYVLQTLELAWDGTCEHTEQGWNTGKACYGYRNDRLPHPVAAKRAEGKTKSRLVPHPAEGPTVTYIFLLRVVHRLGYDTIADRLNLDPQTYPPPTPTNPQRALGRWSGSAVREILCNPKYTGYMVWNRRASKKGGKNNPPSEWVWSPRPTHEPLVTKEVYQKAARIAQSRQGSPVTTNPTRQPKTWHTYALRAFVVCDACGRRMQGNPKKKNLYYVCKPDKREHEDRRDWYARHPKSVWVREDHLLDHLQEFFANRVFGAERLRALRARLADDAPKQESAVQRAKRQILDVEKRQNNVLLQIEDYVPTGDDEIDQDFRRRLQQRYAELGQARKARIAELAALEEEEQPDADQTLLDKLPRLRICLRSLSDDLRRRLFDAFHLEVRYRADTNEVSIKITVKADNVSAITDLADAISGPSEPRALSSTEATRVTRARPRAAVRPSKAVPSATVESVYPLPKPYSRRAQPAQT